MPYPTTYPATFYVIHHRFPADARGPAVWANILDMPGQHFDAVECVLDHFRDEAPTRDTLRAWFMDGIRQHDMTDRLIEVWHERNERLEAAE
jgi:hypothetical protein